MNGFRTYFLFSITNTCNKACEYCIVKPWLNNPNYPDLIKWHHVKKYMSEALERGDLVEITGGEPSLVLWLNDLLDLCASKEAYQVLRTNGAYLDDMHCNPYLVICLNPHNPNVNSHRALRPQDYILHPKPLKPIHDSECKSKDNVQIEELPGIKNNNIHPFEIMQFITADGKIRPMSCTEEMLGYIQNDTPDKLDIVSACPNCPFILNAWNLTGRLHK